jgi:oligopeptide transport system substrate-binding protein
VEIVLDNQEWKVYLKNLDHDPPPLFRLGWGADYPDPDNFLNLFTAGSGNNHTRWQNPEYDRLIQKAAAEPDLKLRKKMYDRAQVILCEEDVPIMPLFVVTTNHLVKPYVMNLQLNPLDFIYWKKVWLATS